MADNKLITIEDVQEKKYYYYTYLVIDLNPHTDAEFYIGSRKCKCLPELDTSYMGSVNSKEWKQDWKNITTRCDKIILKEFDTYTEMLAHEVELHALYKVDTNKKFYNKARQTTTKFYYDATGVKRPDSAVLMKGNSYGKGYKMTEEQRKRCSEACQGFKAYQAIAVDIYEYTSDNLIASRVCLNEWCKMSGVSQGNLTKTKRKEDGSSVRRHHNNMYIKESDGR